MLLVLDAGENQNIACCNVPHVSRRRPTKMPIARDTCSCIMRHCRKSTSLPVGHPVMLAGSRRNHDLACDQRMC